MTEPRTGPSGTGPRSTEPQRPPRKVMATRVTEVLRPSVLEDIFFVVATVGACVFAWRVLLLRGDVLMHLVTIIAFWAVLAYLALPRVNQILTSIYVPDYFIGRTRTADGVLGDAVNVALRGDADQVHAAMQRAGWSLADPVTLRTSWGIVVSSVFKRSYPTAPVSPLFLFGTQEDFAYQMEVDGNAAQRHHVRFWRVPEGWLMPGGVAVDWLASASYDRSVGLSLFTLQVTHNIDADIDVERDHVVTSIRQADPAVTVDVLRDYSTSYHSRNGGGDRIHTDGDLPVVQLSAVTGVPTVVPHPPRRSDPGARPPSVVVAVLLLLLALAVSLVQDLPALLVDDPRVATGLDSLSEAGTARAAAIGVVVATTVAMVLLAGLTWLGNPWARIALLVVTALSLGTHLAIGDSDVTSLLGAGVDLAMMYALTSSGARRWTGPVRAAYLSLR